VLHCTGVYLFWQLALSETFQWLRTKLLDRILRDDSILITLDSIWETWQTPYALRLLLCRAQPSFSTHSNPLLIPRQTDSAVKFKPLTQTGITYELEWKDVAAQWESGRSGKKVTVDAASPTCKAQAAPLEPGTTYCVRLSVKDASGQSGTPGSELIIDTEQVGCTPKDSSGCCVLL
jgi:hypothetical protein